MAGPISASQVQVYILQVRTLQKLPIHLESMLNEKKLYWTKYRTGHFQDTERFLEYFITTFRRYCSNCIISWCSWKFRIFIRRVGESLLLKKSQQRPAHFKWGDSAAIQSAIWICCSWCHWMHWDLWISTKFIKWYLRELSIKGCRSCNRDELE